MSPTTAAQRNSLTEVDYPVTQTKVRGALFSFFAGAGFLDLGFEKAGFQTVFVNEYHAPFLDAYQFSRRAMGMPRPMFGYLPGDISALLCPGESNALQKRVEQSRRSFDCVGFIGGPPCPDFSVGGKNRGRHGENGILSDIYVKLICDQQPDFFVFENVKGLWRTRVHRAFYEELKTRLRKSGYLLTDQLVNAIEYGAPQDRDRIILIGFRKASFPQLIDADEALDFPWSDFKKFKWEKIKTAPWPSQDSFSCDSKKAIPAGIEVSLTVQHWFEKNSVSTHPNASDCFAPRAALPKFQRIDEGDDSKKCFKRLHRWRYSPTAAYGNNEVHLHPYKARRLTVAEALAIQSLPKEFVMPPEMSLTDKFKSIGNGVPFELAHGIALSIQRFLGVLG